MLSYFADYEVMACGRAFRWGHVTHTLPGAVGTALDADALVHTLRSLAADRHGVDVDDIRIRLISRLI
jgi:hypothetical protein